MYEIILLFPLRSGLGNLFTIENILLLTLIFHICRKSFVAEMLLIWILTFKNSLITAILIVKIWSYDKTSFST